MTYNQQFLAFIGQLAKQSGDYAICECIKRGYQICCEGIAKLDNEYHEQTFLPTVAITADFEKRIDQLVDKLCDNNGFTRKQINNSMLSITNNIVTITLHRDAERDGSDACYYLRVEGVDPELDKMIQADMFKPVKSFTTYSTSCARGWGARAFADDRRQFLICLEHAATVKLPTTINELRNALNQLDGTVPRSLPEIRKLSVDYRVKKRGWGVPPDGSGYVNTSDLCGYIINQIKLDPLSYTDIHELNLDFFAKILINGDPHPTADDMYRFGNTRRLSQRELDRRNQK